MRREHAEAILAVLRPIFEENRPGWPEPAAMLMTAESVICAMAVLIETYPSTQLEGVEYERFTDAAAYLSNAARMLHQRAKKQLT